MSSALSTVLVVCAAAGTGSDVHSSDDTRMSLIPGRFDPNRICYECPTEIYAEMVAQKDPLVKAHTKVSGGCADQGFAKSLINDPVFRDAKLFVKGKVQFPHSDPMDTRMSLIPGRFDPNRICYECPTESYAEMVAQKDPLVKAHTKVSGGCADQGYAKSLVNDPVFRDAKLFRKGRTSLFGEGLDITWEDCGDASTHGRITDLQIGQDGALIGSGTIDEELTGGSFEIKISASRGIHDTYTGKACDTKTFKLPLGLGTVSWEGMDCPVAAGPVTTKIGFTVSSLIPASLGTVDVHASALDMKGEAALCLAIQMQPASNAVSV